MMQALIGQNAHPADTAQIDLYHVDAGFFVRFVLSQVILRALYEILPFLEIASTSRASVTGRSSGFDTALDFHKQNMRFIFANNIGLQMTAPIIAFQNKITARKQIAAGKILSRSANFKISHFSLFQRRTGSSFCVRGKVRFL